MYNKKMAPSCSEMTEGVEKMLYNFLSYKWAELFLKC